MIFAGRQVEARGVLDIFLARVQRRIEIQLDGFARAADRSLHFVDHFADDVERRLVLVAAFHKRNLRAGHQQRNRHGIAIVVEPEVHGVEIDCDVGSWQIAGHLIGEFLLAVLRSGVLKIRGRVVSLAVLDLHAGPLHLHGQLAILAVARWILRMKTDGVVGRSILLHLRKGRRKIVGVEEGLAASVAGKRRHHFLAGEVGVHVVGERGTVVTAAATLASGGCVAKRTDGLEAARVHTVDGEIGAHRSVGGGAQRGLVLNAIARDTAREIEQRLLLVDFCQRLRHCAQRKKFAIGVQIVVLALVGRVTGGVFHLVCVCSGALRKSLAFGAVVDSHFIDQCLLVGCEILIDFQRLVQGDQRN